MIDAYAMDELDHIDALYLGLSFPSKIATKHAYAWHGWEERIAFARQLNHGPWAQIVRRRAIVRRNRIFQLESRWMWDYIWPPHAPDAIRQQEEREREIRELRGYL